MSAKSINELASRESKKVKVTARVEELKKEKVTLETISNEEIKDNEEHFNVSRYARAIGDYFKFPLKSPCQLVGQYSQ